MPRSYTRIPATERIARFFGEPTAMGCIEFMGARMATGYGMIGGAERPLPAHRVAWERVHGPIPAGMEIGHRCDNRPCVNVEHLFLATHQENMADMVSKGRHRNQKKTHCPEGHPFEGDNLLLHGYGDGKVMRRCRTCFEAKARANYLKRKAARCPD